MRRGKSSGIGALILLIVGLYLLFNYWQIALALAGIWLAFIVAKAFLTPSRCTACGGSFKQKYFTITDSSGKKVLCPTCHQQYRQQVSRKAIRQTMISQDIAAGVKCPSCHTEYKPLDESCRKCGRMR